jgi:hypothetical protein
VQEIQRVSKIQSEPPGDKKVSKVGHYPDDMELYYPGFEVFVWDAPTSIMVGGIEVGPAKKAGIHLWRLRGIGEWGSPVGKSVAELEHSSAAAFPPI